MMIAEFKQEVLDIADDVGVKPKEIHIRRMNKKWASCSSRGRLTFSFELLEKELEFRINTVLHELLHLRYPTHNKMFKNVLNAHSKRIINKRKRKKK